MGARLWGAVLAGVTGLVGASGASGCERLDGCVNDRRALEEGRNGGEAPSLLTCMPVDAEGGGGDGGGGSGGGNGVCVPSESDAPVNDGCGVFVSSSFGDDGNEGTKASPVKTLSRALQLAKASGLPVLACGEAMVEEAEGIIVAGGQRIFGGLDCTAKEPNTWIFDRDKPTEVSAPTDKVPMRLEKGSGTELSDLIIQARDAATPAKPSIAVIASDVTAKMIRVTMKAGNGAKGVDGAPPQGDAEAGQNGSNGSGACTGSPSPGGIGPENSCSSGGNGGNGSVKVGLNGSSGGPADGSSNYGMGASDVVSCSNGADGVVGAPGMDAVAASGLGTINAEDGHVGVSGQNGADGAPGKGGGGGGGTRAVVNNVDGCNSGGTKGGAGGGSGASGGCGGKGGAGGSSGGASIGLVSLQSRLSFLQSKIITGKGGEPGLGSDGQEGGLGGAMGGKGGAGNGSVNEGCKGGSGGNGGRGGRGGNGAQGYSIGIAFTEPVGVPNPLAFTQMTFEFPDILDSLIKDKQKFE